MTIRYLHYRPYTDPLLGPIESPSEASDNECVVEGKGGATVAYTEDEGNTTISFGVSYCNDVDNFNRRLGRLISKGRLNIKPETFTGDYKAFIKQMDETFNAVCLFRSIQVFPKA